MGAKTDIKFFVHTNNNAPQLQNAFGSMINVLDAALVNGMQVGTVSSLTASGKIVTAVFGTAHNLMPYQVIKIAGTNQAEYNGEYRILSVPNATTLTFELTEVPSTTIATGTINCSLPPLGWEKPFSSSNPNGGGKAAYRSKNLMLSSRPFLRVVDEMDPVQLANYTKFAKVGIVEDMTDIDTMLGVQAPFDPAAPNKNWVGTGTGNAAYNGWAKWIYATNSDNFFSENSVPPAGIRNWLLVGNGDYFYIFPAQWNTTTSNAVAYGFGAFKSLINADTSNTFLSSTLNYATQSTSYFRGQWTGLADNQQPAKLLVQRGYSQAAQYTVGYATSLALSNTANMYSGAQNYIGAYNLTNIAPFAPVFFNETVLRGEVPGIYWLFQNRPYNHLQIIEKDGGAYMAVNVVQSSGTNGQVVVKIGGS